jgi:hypothetical protein|tara:strand:+ start:333 stop:620 length:288 start_codon:yes stop_codon:yes gene_type:complete
MSLEEGTQIMILSALDHKRVSNRTRNKIHEHGGTGFIVLLEPRNTSFDRGGGKWIMVKSLEENVSLGKWGQPGRKEAWQGWLPMDEIRIKYTDDT